MSQEKRLTQNLINIWNKHKSSINNIPIFTHDKFKDFRSFYEDCFVIRMSIENGKIASHKYSNLGKNIESFLEMDDLSLEAVIYMTDIGSVNYRKVYDNKEPISDNVSFEISNEEVKYRRILLPYLSAENPESEFIIIGGMRYLNSRK